MREKYSQRDNHFIYYTPKTSRFRGFCFSICRKRQILCGVIKQLALLCEFDSHSLQIYNVHYISPFVSIVHEIFKKCSNYLKYTCNYSECRQNQRVLYQSLGQAFSRACGFLRRNIKSSSADNETPKRSSFIQTFFK